MVGHEGAVQVVKWASWTSENGNTYQRIVSGGSDKTVKVRPLSTATHTGASSSPAAPTRPSIAVGSLPDRSQIAVRYVNDRSMICCSRPNDTSANNMI
eukprot:5504090-Pyramimonas_sp.AAC.1